MRTATQRVKQVGEELRASRGPLRQQLDHSPAVLQARRPEGKKIIPCLARENNAHLLGPGD